MNERNVNLTPPNNARSYYQTARSCVYACSFVIDLQNYFTIRLPLSPRASEGADQLRGRRDCTGSSQGMEDVLTADRNCIIISH